MGRHTLASAGAALGKHFTTVEKYLLPPDHPRALRPRTRDAAKVREATGGLVTLDNFDDEVLLTEIAAPAVHELAGAA